MDATGRRLARAHTVSSTCPLYSRASGAQNCCRATEWVMCQSEPAPPHARPASSTQPVCHPSPFVIQVRFGFIRALLRRTRRHLGWPGGSR